ncbi:unnamed protein product [Amoebophrya sp. A25]|nr:unnamed protein product [Amoebophrya sp. A25]|eukprot:GSA25T00005000001.1
MHGISGSSSGGTPLTMSHPGFEIPTARSSAATSGSGQFGTSRLARRYERGRDAKMSIDEMRTVTVEGLLQIAKDKWKSRSLQRSLMESDEEMTTLIYEKAEPAFIQLLSDQYGNYLSQKILEHCSDEHFDTLFSKVEDQLATLANEVHGTRAVQKFVEEGIRRGRTQKIIDALLDSVESLSRSVTGFHVVVKLLEKLESPYSEDVLKKLCYDRESVVTMSKDQWGCCVLKTCIDKAGDAAQQRFITETIVGSTLELVQDPYGNYVVQHLLATTKPSEDDFVLPQMIERLKDHVLDLCQQKFSSNVLEKVLTTAPDSQKAVLIQGVLTAGKMEIHNVVQHLLFHQYGNYVLQQTLSVAKEPHHTTLIDAIRPHVHSILRHMLEGDAVANVPIPRRGSNSLQPEQAQRLAVKLAKRFPRLLEGMQEHEKHMLNTPLPFPRPDMASLAGGGAAGAGSALNGFQSGGGYADYAALLQMQQTALAYNAYPGLLYGDLATAAALQSAGAGLGMSQGTAGQHMRPHQGGSFRKGMGKGQTDFLHNLAKQPGAFQPLQGSPLAPAGNQLNNIMTGMMQPSMIGSAATSPYQQYGNQYGYGSNLNAAANSMYAAAANQQHHTTVKGKGYRYRITTSRSSSSRTRSSTILDSSFPTTRYNEARDALRNVVILQTDSNNAYGNQYHSGAGGYNNQHQQHGASSGYQHQHGGNNAYNSGTTGGHQSAGTPTQQHHPGMGGNSYNNQSGNHGYHQHHQNTHTGNAASGNQHLSGMTSTGGHHQQQQHHSGQYNQQSTAPPGMGHSNVTGQSSHGAQNNTNQYHGYQSGQSYQSGAGHQQHMNSNEGMEGQKMMQFWPNYGQMAGAESAGAGASPY